MSTIPYSIKIKNCNNIDTGIIALAQNRLNIKYGCNGTGKTTIAKAISYAIENNDNLSELKPFKHFGNDLPENLPSIEGLENINSIKIFDEKYIEQFLYLPDELVKDSFEIFVRTPKYDKLSLEIDTIINTISDTFKNDEELESTINAFNDFFQACSPKSSTELAKNKPMHKGLGLGNKIAHIPEELKSFSSFLQNTSNGQNIKWLKWQSDGQNYIEESKHCPFCTASTEKTLSSIRRISEEYSPKTIEHLVKILNVFEMLNPYFTDEAKAKIKEITNNIGEMSQTHQTYLVEVSNQVQDIYRQLTSIKNLNLTHLHKFDKVAEEIKKLKIDLSCASHLNSEKMAEKAKSINESLETILVAAGQLQRCIAQQKRIIEENIKNHKDEINDFLKSAGYSYSVDIHGSDTSNYKITLSHNDDSESSSIEVKKHLSYGEKNAFALVMFMYDVLHEKPDLVILDDPLSSFDGNKQFALLNLLFMGKTCLKDFTVLVLTHEFHFLLDCVYNFSGKIPASPVASYIFTTNNCLSEIPIERSDFLSIANIALENITTSSNVISKCVYLRRFLEVSCIHNDGTEESENATHAYNMLASLFKLRTSPTGTNITQEMSKDEKDKAEEYIKKYIFSFSYDQFLSIFKDKETLNDIYFGLNNNYEKLHIYRVFFKEIDDIQKKALDPIRRRFINSVYHVENDLVFQLNPKKYPIIPEFIISQCDQDIIAEMTHTFETE